MLIFFTTLLATLSSILCSRAALELENLALRHQLGVLQRSARKRPRLTAGDRLFEGQTPIPAATTRTPRPIAQPIQSASSVQPASSSHLQFYADRRNQSVHNSTSTTQYAQSDAMSDPHS